MEEKKGSYTYSDIEHIIEHHFKNESHLLDLANYYLFYDTEWINFKLWLSIKYDKRLTIVDEAIEKKPFDFYLLTYPDLVWKEDSLREMPDKLSRISHFERFFTEIQKTGIPYAIIKGSGDDRLNNAIDAIEEQFG